MVRELSIRALENFPLVEAGDDLARLIADAMAENKIEPMDGDIFVLAQKIVSKATDCLVDLQTITPGEKARELASIVNKDPRLVEVILTESRAVLRHVPDVLITEHHSGWIMANAGIDASNVAGEDEVLLLPRDPDGYCGKLRQQLQTRYAVNVGVLINDSFGRPWRLGTTGVALGAAGLPSLWDRRGDTDLFGRELKVSQQAIADEIAAAASLLQGQGNEGRPVILIRGFDFAAPGSPPERPAADLLRSTGEDLFR
ncbi:MAG: coenzyme F420-0:L-glutamate ligase [Alphaproteobacteria bacterium]|nr:coenzyme F420-0:L-glutamate ligase [Alphaproteobacteria bacterium]